MNKFRFILMMTFFFLLSVACSTTDANEEPSVVEETLPVKVETETDADTLEIFVEQLQTAVIDQDYSAMQALMDDSMLVAGWRSEGRVYEAAPMVAEFQNDSLPAPTAVQFTSLTESELTTLLGQPPASILGSTATVVATLHSEGWGVEGNDEAILYVLAEDGRYTWSAFLYTFGSFAQNGDDTDSSIFVVETDVKYVQAQQDVVMYSGPADTYDEIGSIFDGQTALVTGQSEDGNWLRVICPDDKIGDCWVTAESAFTLPTTP